jgi:uncharacterized protein
MSLFIILILLLCGYLAGLLGALLGLGGGLILIPILVTFFKVELLYAMGIAFLAAVANSLTASLRLSRNKLTNVKVGILLEVGTVIGAVIGAYLAQIIATSYISILFGLVLVFSVWISLTKFRNHGFRTKPHPWDTKLNLSQDCNYKIRHVPAGMSLMSIAGLLAGLLGIGSGAFKVVIFDIVMGLPYKAASATSNYMIGMTSAAGAAVYLASGYILPELAFAIIPGVLLGSLSGAHLLVVAESKYIRILFNIILLFLAYKMISKGIALL